jgi:bifunctional UDP-N-acetylglucosamine pyrophosphorylase/glucosamine-1-phosphate N-acetyltransferase
MTDKLTIVILAAGLGTRMKSRKAKVLHEAGGLTLVEHVVNSALEVTSPERIVVVVGHQAETVRAILAPKNISFAEQAEQKGTGHALEMCRSVVSDFDGRVVVLYGDCPLLAADTLRSLLAHHEQSGAAATVITAMLDDPTGYGRAIVDANGFVQAIVEQKVASAEQKAVKQINSGIYCFDASLLWQHLQTIEANPVSNEYYLTDIVEILNGAGHKVSALLHDDVHELLGINTKVELAQVDRLFRERINTRLMLEGAIIQRPETVTIDANVTVGMDTVIEPFVQLIGKTVIGENSRIGAGSIIRDSQIESGVDILPYTIINTSYVETGASVGPFARLRMENHVGADAHIGNFVELKKTRLGNGTKAGHLAYLGDSETGERVNIGAGTITCNYDGVVKRKTTIEADAFVGSNSTLVAPVQVGKGCYIAAGSVITENVPENALGLGRSRQSVKENWAAKRRERLKNPS